MTNSVAFLLSETEKDHISSPSVTKASEDEQSKTSSIILAVFAPKAHELRIRKEWGKSLK